MAGLATRLGLLAARERLEQLAEPVGRDAAALVGHRYQQAGTSLARRQCHRAALTRVFDRVAEQVHQDPLDFAAVQSQWRQPRLERNRDAHLSGLRRVLQRQARDLKNLRQLGSLEYQIVPTGLDHRDIEQLIDQARHCGGAPLNDGQELQVLVGHAVRCFVEQDAGIGLHHTHGLAQVVRGKADKAVFQRVQALQLRIGLVQRTCGAVQSVVDTNEVALQLLHRTNVDLPQHQHAVAAALKSAQDGLRQVRLSQHIEPVHARRFLHQRRQRLRRLQVDEQLGERAAARVTSDQLAGKTVGCTYNSALVQHQIEERCVVSQELA